MSKKKQATTKEKNWQQVIGETEQPAGLEHPEYEELEAKLTEAEQKADQHWNDLLRIKADMDNLRRRTERDVANAHKYALERFASELLPVVDSLERGLASSDTHNGMLLTRDLLLKTLQKFAIEQIDPIGHDFDHNLHEAMSMREDPKVKPNSVVEVLQKGYTLNGRLLRPALVIVAKAT